MDSPVSRRRYVELAFEAVGGSTCLCLLAFVPSHIFGWDAGSGHPFTLGSTLGCFAAVAVVFFLALATSESTRLTDDEPKQLTIDDVDVDADSKR